jgi:hypothetical protein
LCEREGAGRVGIFPETAQPTRRIAVALLWIFALILSYEFLPGFQVGRVQGVTVFVGLIISARIYRHHEPGDERPDGHLFAGGCW